MGNLAWWLYDLIAVAAVILCIFLSARKGIFKSAVTLVACLIAVLLSVPVSSGISDSIYKTVVRDNVVKKLDKSLSEVEVADYWANSIELMEYGVFVKTAKLNEILESDKDVSDELYKYLNSLNGKKVDNEASFRDKLKIAYSDVFDSIFEKDLNKYTLAVAHDTIENGKVDFGSLMKMMKEVDQHMKVSEIIADDYIGNAYRTIIRLVVYAVLFAVIMLMGFLTGNSLAGTNRGGEGSTGSRVAGGICGVFTGVGVVFVIAVLLRLSCVMGDKPELYFENTSIDKSYIFRYAYNIASEL